MSDPIDRQAALGAIKRKLAEPAYQHAGEDWYVGMNDAESELLELPSAQLDTAEKLYQYKCYVTDKEGLQHEVVHTGDIRRVTGWEI